MGYLWESKLTDAIIISGASGSGKTTLSKWLARRLNARVLNAGDVVLHTVLTHNLAPVSRADAGRLFMEHFGELALGPLLLRHLRPFERVIIDGLRLPFAKEFLEDRLARRFHLHLDVTDEVRQQRLLLRDGRVDVSDHAESFLSYMRQEADLVVADLELHELDYVSTFSHQSVADFSDLFRVGPPAGSKLDFTPSTFELSEGQWRFDGARHPPSRLDITFASALACMASY